MYTELSKPLLSQSVSQRSNETRGPTFANKEDYSVTVYLWNQAAKGHVAIEICHHGRSIYISLYPIANEAASGNFFHVLCVALKTLFYTRARLACKSEVNFEPLPRVYTFYGKLKQVPQDCTFIYGFDTEKMFRLASEYKSDLTEFYDQSVGLEADVFHDDVDAIALSRIKYGLCGCLGAQVCSVIVANLLRHGGMLQLFPNYFPPYDPRHLLTLSLRPTLAIALFAVIFNSFLMTDHERSLDTELVAGGGLFFQLLCIFLLDKHLIPQGYIPFLNRANARVRKIAEPFNVCAHIHIIALFGYIVGGLFYLYSLEQNGKDLAAYKVGLDFLGWLGYSLMGMYGVGTLASCLLYCVYGLGLPVRPCGVERMLLHLEGTRELTAGFKHYFFMKELTLMFIPVISMIVFYSEWKFDPVPLTSAIKGILMGASAGYVGAKLAQIGLERRARVLTHQLARLQRKSAEAYLLYKSHDPRPAQFVLVSAGTLFGVIASMQLTQHYVSDNLLLNAAVSVFGATIGYLAGAFVHQGAAGVRAYASRLFQVQHTSRQSEQLLHL